MATSEAKKKASVKYQKKTYTVFGYQVKKEKDPVIRAYAAAAGMTISRLIDAAVTEYIDNHPIKE